MNCPGSLRISAGIEDPGSIYAAEGTAAHELGEKCLRDGKDAADYAGEKITVGNHVFEVDDDMAAAVQVYLDTVRKEVRPGDDLAIEHKFDLSEIVHDGMFGTNDASIFRPSTGELFVFDYKHGAGYAVEAEANPQLLYYAVGAATQKAGRRISTVTIVIVQPRAMHPAGPVRRWSAPAIALAEWMDDLKAAAIATMNPDAPLKTGPWCKFCRAAGICPKLREEAFDAANAEFDTTPADMPPEVLAGILEKADLIEDWIKAVRAYAHSTLDAGGTLPGWKLVQKRAVRKWSLDDDLLAPGLAREFGLVGDELYVRKLKSPAQIEKLLPKAERGKLKEYVSAVSSGTTLAREADPRAAVSGQGGADADFELAD